MDDASPRTWHLERRSPVRADAEGIFVPVADLPRAAIGDRVVVEGHEGGEVRTGTIEEVAEREAAQFFRLALDE